MLNEETTPAVVTAMRELHADIGAYSPTLHPNRALRPYQLDFARAVADSVVERRGESFAAVFSRQSGKDEALAHFCETQCRGCGRW